MAGKKMYIALDKDRTTIFSVINQKVSVTGNKIRAVRACPQVHEGIRLGVIKEVSEAEYFKANPEAAPKADPKPKAPQKKKAPAKVPPAKVPPANVPPANVPPSNPAGNPAGATPPKE